MESRYSKLTSTFIEELSKISSPLLGDIVSTMLNEGERALPVDIDRCSVADKMLMGKIAASGAGKQGASSYFENECRGWRRLVPAPGR